MLVLSPERLRYETERAEEIQRAEEALFRERLLWFGVAMACVAAGFWMVGMGFHAHRLSIAGIWISGGLLVGDLGPLVVLLIAHQREQM
jgi:hypothetical protein